MCYFVLYWWVLYFGKKDIAIKTEKEIITVKQVAQYLQMNEHTIYKLSRSGKIPALKITGIPKYQLIPYLSDQTSISYNRLVEVC